MDRVVTSLLVIDEHGNVEEQAGSFSDWEARGGTLLSTVDEARSVTSCETEPSAPKQEPSVKDQPVSEAGTTKTQAQLQRTARTR